MALVAKTIRRGRVPQRQSSVSVHLPAPVGGLNTVAPASAMPPSDCLQLKNMIPYQYGLRVRSGYREWATSVGAAQAPAWAALTTYALGAVVSSNGKLYRVTTVGASPNSRTAPSGTTTFTDTAPSTLVWTCVNGLNPYPPGNDPGSWVADAPLGARTLLGFTGSRADGSNDRLWAVCADGIYDVTLPTASPTKVYSFTDPGYYPPEAGRGVGTAFTNVNGDHYYAYCDGYYGYLLYSEKTQAWTAITMGSTPGTQIQASANAQSIGLTCNPTRFRFVMQWKSRLWFVEEDSTFAWYLDVGAFAGDANQIPFAPRFKNGGYLTGLWSWTVDGGTGVDDYLVGISSGGDVVVYSGTDPSIPGAFVLRGVWWAGRPPPGRHVASSFGGDLFILSTVGCTPLSKLVAGGVLQDTSGGQAGKVANLFNKLMTDRVDERGWAVVVHPTDNIVVVTVPPRPGELGLQMVMSLANQGWAQHYGVPMACVETWHNRLYFGTSDGRVCTNDGSLDNQPRDPIAPGDTVAVPIEWALQTSFQNAGSPDKKRLHMVRPYFVTDGTPPGVGVGVRYDFDLTDISLVTLTQRTIPNSWDVSVWDTGVWEDSSGDTSLQYGVTGIGSNVSIIMQGSSTTATTFVGFDVMLEKGGLL